MSGILCASIPIDVVKLSELSVNLNPAYPNDLAEFISHELRSLCEGDGWALDTPMLGRLFSICYQASLSTIEGKAVTCRVIFCEADGIPEGAQSPLGLQSLQFVQPLSFNRHELRRLSTAADYERSLLAVSASSANVNIWGIVHSGPRWLHSLRGGRGYAAPLPECLVVNINGPGHLEICWGSNVIGELIDGEVVGVSTNIFQSKWLQESFAEIRAERQAIHQAAREAASTVWADLDPDLTRVIDQHMTKRVIAAMRAYRHGGTLIMIPPENAVRLSEKNPFMSIKHPFLANEQRAIFRTLIIAVMNRLAEIGPVDDGNMPIGWEYYQLTTDSRISALDEAIFELSHLIAALSTTDGAVVLTKRFELLGFGAEIHCDGVEITQIAHALDLEGSHTELELVTGLGTRHRSVYRLCHELQDCLAIVVSQDGAVQFVRWKDGFVTYWNHHASFKFSTLS
jgi:hypothetical protein